ncbi:MAG: RecX family transcriptional regulator [Candidatus Saccharibacteria bacterium]|nr:RecX family transcriptional regulator [Candidatus Saccharibacteria bacterium]
MKVTAITQQAKNKNRYSVFVDEKYSFSLSMDGLLEAKLKTGDELSEAEVRQFKKQSEDGKLYDRLIGLLAKRPRSRWELEEYLKRKKVEPETQAQLLGKLEDKKLIDDQDFARRWVENRRLLKPMSRRKLRQELMQKRIDHDIIERVLEEDESSERGVLRELIEKKRHISKYKNDRQKFMQYLARQGFNYGDIKDVLHETDTSPGD